MSSSRVAIVTGAARGIGAATALRLAKDGHAVAVLDLDESACASTVSAITEAGARHRGRGGRVPGRPGRGGGEPGGRRALGAPSILVNNAGIIRDNLIFKMTEDDWDAVMAVHLRGAFLMTRAVQAHMTKERYGRIVNLSSRLRAGEPRPGELLGRQGRARGLHEDARDRARQVRRHGQCRCTRLHPDGDDPVDGRAHGGVVRGLHRALGVADPGAAGRPARRHRGDHLVPLQRRGRLRLRPGHLRRRRPLD